jgi:hypothetical protein
MQFWKELFAQFLPQQVCGPERGNSVGRTCPVQPMEVFMRFIRSIVVVCGQTLHDDPLSLIRPSATFSPWTREKGQAAPSICAGREVRVTGKASQECRRVVYRACVLAGHAFPCRKIEILKFSKPCSIRNSAGDWGVE